MTALKCDRCNGYFDYNPNAENFIAFGHKNIIVEREHPIKDICSSCMKSFKVWYESPNSLKPEDSLAYLIDDERIDKLYKEAEEISNNAGDTKEE